MRTRLPLGLAVLTAAAVVVPVTGARAATPPRVSSLSRVGRALTAQGGAVRVTATVPVGSTCTFATTAKPVIRGSARCATGVVDARLNVPKNPDSRRTRNYRVTLTVKGPHGGKTSRSLTVTVPRWQGHLTSTPWALPGQTATIAGTDFKPRTAVGAVLSATTATTSVVTGASGGFSGALGVPLSTDRGVHAITATGRDPLGQTLTAATAVAVGYDDQAPVVTGPGQADPLAVLSNSLDPITGVVGTRFRMHLTDDLSGVSTILVTFWSGDPTQPQLATSTLSTSLVSGDPRDGTYILTIPIPPHTPAGSYPLMFLTIKDNAGNQRFYDRSRLYALGYGPADLTVVTDGTQGAADHEAPTLVGPGQPGSLAVGPSVIDTSLAPARIHLTVRLKDDLSGLSPVGSGQALFSNGASYFQYDFCCPPGTAAGDLYEPSQGTDLDRTFSVNAVLPAHSAAGPYTLTQLSTTDRVGNRRFYTLADLEALGYSAAQLTVTQVGGGVDSSPPQIVGANQVGAVSISPQHVDTAAAAAEVHISVRVTDDLSGAAGATVTFVNGAYQVSTGTCLPSGCDTSGGRVSGTALDGTYDEVVQVPANAPAGTYTVSRIDVGDATGNSHTYTPAELSALGYGPLTFTNGPS